MHAAELNERRASRRVPNPRRVVPTASHNLLAAFGKLHRRHRRLRRESHELLAVGGFPQMGFRAADRQQPRPIRRKRTRP